MAKKKSFLSIFVLLIFIMGCNLSAKDFSIVPYELQGKFVCEQNSSEYEKGGIFCNFENKVEKTVKKIYIVFSLYDGEGVPLQQNVIDVDSCIPSFEKASFVFNLDNFLSGKSGAVNNYCVDFIYASKIIYEDGTEWSDPLGIKAFL